MTFAAEVKLVTKSQYYPLSLEEVFLANTSFFRRLTNFHRLVTLLPNFIACLGGVVVVGIYT